jgi:hypothetical protein
MFLWTLLDFETDNFPFDAIMDKYSDENHPNYSC